VDSPIGDCCIRDGVAGDGIPTGECWPSDDGEYCRPRGNSGPIIVALTANNKNIQKLIYIRIKSIALIKNKQFTQL
jgi:hypothetical protein